MDLLVVLFYSMRYMAKISFCGRHSRSDIVTQSVRCYLAHALSYRDIEEMMQHCGINVDYIRYR